MRCCMIIKITQKNINKGKKSDPFSCPFALALKEAGIKNPRVFPNYVDYLAGEGGLVFTTRKQVKLSKKANKWITAFDENGGKKNAQPAQFRIIGI